jgi:hypothetical protein
MLLLPKPPSWIDAAGMAGVPVGRKKMAVFDGELMAENCETSPLC